MGADRFNAPGGAAISIDGDLDVGTVSAVTERIAAVGDRIVRVDTAGLTFVDSTGLAGLLDVQAAMERDGRRLELLNCPPPLTRLLEITALEDRFAPQDPPAD
jgi:anti-anti-sigma factor